MNTNGLFSSLADIPVIGVAIGLMFTYLIASLVASAVKEAIAGVFEWRGTYLQQGIGVLLSHAQNTAFAWGGLRNWLSAHLTWEDPTGSPPEAVTVARKAVDAALKAVALGKAAAADPARNPEAAGAATAADAAANAANAAVTAKNKGSDPAILAQVAETAAQSAARAARSHAADDLAAADKAIATAQAALKVYDVQTHPLIKGTPSKLPSYVPAQDFATALLDMLRDGSGSPVFTQAERTVAALPDGDIRRILSAFIQDAAGDLDKFRARIEKWFDDSMDRLSGIYKRFVQWFLLALGLAFAMTLNVDSVHLAVALWDQPALRAQIVAQAQAQVQSGSPQSPGTETSTPSAPGTPAPTGTNPPSVDVLLSGVAKATQRLQDLPLPIGRAACASWFGEPTPLPDAPAAAASAKTSAKPAHCVAPLDGTYPSGWCGWNWWTILGWIITAFAISLGAPFWFDLLQNIMSLRAAGSPPKRADAAPTS